MTRPYFYDHSFSGKQTPGWSSGINSSMSLTQKTPMSK